MKRTFLQASFAIAAGLLALVALWQLAGQQAQARPQYNKAFKAKYADFKVEDNERCNICHIGKDKKMRNDYGKAVGKAIGEKNCKAADKIEAGLTAAESEKDPASGSSYGDLIKENKLPITK